MSYTLRGRLESRLVAALLPLAVAAVLAAVLDAWWPVELAFLMLAVGVALDALVLHRVLVYQAGWVALPLGLAELALVMALARVVGVEAPVVPAVAFFAGAWLLAQVLGHAVFPLLQMSYAEDGGELRRVGALAAAVVLAIVAFAGGVAAAGAPPTVRLSAGVHRGPLVLDRAQTLVGEPGAVVRGGIVVRADDVIVRDLVVEGGETGIAIDDAEDVVLERVSVVRARMDGIAARQSSVTIRDCVVRGLAPEHTQGIDLSFAAHEKPSLVEGCRVEGGAEGIATQMVHVDVRDNVVSETTRRGISLNEMSMGRVEENVVADALGIGILCMDYSLCEIEQNRVTGTRADVAAQTKSSMGYAIVAHYGSAAQVRENHLVGNAAGVAAFINSRISPHEIE